jgi:capsule polysaccharide export protein KpsE/RkpR
MEKTLTRMHKRIHFDTPDLVTIVISATDPDPEKASEIVNAFLEQLEVASQTLSLSRTRRTRRLVSEALVQTEAELDSTRRKMQEFQETYGVFSIEKQTEGTLELIGALQTELLAAKAQRDQLGGFTSEGSSPLRNLDLKIEAIQTQIRQLVIGDMRAMIRKDEEAEMEPEGIRSSESFFLPLSNIPGLAGKYADIFMNLSVQEAKYNILATQLEQTKIEESQSIPSFEILDWGRRPYKKSGPKRKLYVLAALAAGTLGGILLCVLLDDVTSRVDEPTRRELAALIPGFVKRRFRT